MYEFIANLSRRTLIIVTLAGLALDLALIFVPKSLAQSRSIPLPAYTITYYKHGQKVDSGLPARLKIPKIKVDAAIDPMGVTPNGEMEAYSGLRRVGWFKFGAHPGDNGSAVIAGHYGRWANGEGSVFDNLNKLKPGDSLYVQDDKGAIVAFVVRESRSYDPKADASNVFGSNDGQPHLNLITCEGVWNEAQKSYSQRLVVFADKQ